MTYPDGEVLRYRYDSGGLVSGATGTKLGVTYCYRAAQLMPIESRPSMGLAA